MGPLGGSGGTRAGAGKKNEEERETERGGEGGFKGRRKNVIFFSLQSDFDVHPNTAVNEFGRKIESKYPKTKRNIEDMFCRLLSPSIKTSHCPINLAEPQLSGTASAVCFSLSGPSLGAQLRVPIRCIVSIDDPMEGCVA